MDAGSDWPHDPVVAGFVLIAATAFSAVTIGETMESTVVSGVATLVVASAILLGWTYASGR